MSTTLDTHADSGIVVRGLTKDFGEHRAVDQLDMDVRFGRVTGFLGPNGSGKTTTLMMILGLLTPTRGTATLCGHPVKELDEPLRHVGASLEATAFARHRTARQHLRCWAPLAGATDSRVNELLDEVGLTRAADQRVGTFSLGMRQRLSLATALLGDPRVLILDEPANGLDPEGILWLRKKLREYADQGRAVLVSSHVLTEMERLIDDVVVIRAGQMRHAGPLAEVINDPAHDSLESAYVHLTTQEGDHRESLSQL